MIKLKKRNILIVLALLVVMVFGVVGCNTSAQNDLQGKIDDLRSQIEEMEGRLAEMDDEISKRDAAIEDLNDEIKKRDEKIEQFEKVLAEKSVGEFYTLQEAYNNGWLTQADLMSIAYYHNCGRRYNEGNMDKDYKPSPKVPEVLSKETELKIKITAAKVCREEYNTKYAEADGFTITEYSGTYNGCVAVMMRDEYSGTTGVEWTDLIAGVNIHYGSGKTIQIWREKGQGSDCANDGAYFITDESYERYVRNCAAQIGADEQWISDVLNGGDGGEWHYMIRPKSWFWCVIADNQITVSNIESTVYHISKYGNIYQGKSITQTITFGVSGDILYLSDKTEILQFKKDSSYQRQEDEANILGAPQNVTVDSGGTGLDFVMLQWNYLPEYGTFGAAIEIKTSGSQEYKAVQKIERAYMNGFVVQLDESNFETGVNWVRLYHIGGPSITNDHTVILNKNSDYTTFRVTVNNDRSIQVEEIKF